VEWTAGSGGKRLVFIFEESAVVRRVVRRGPPETLPPDLEPAAIIGHPFSLEIAGRILSETRGALIEDGRVFVSLDRPSWDPESGTLTIAPSEGAIGRITTEVQGEVRLERADRVLREIGRAHV